jgi:hypothetical protein
MVRDWLIDTQPQPLGQPTEQMLDKEGQPMLPVQKTILEKLSDLGLSKKAAFTLVASIQNEVHKSEQIKRERRLQQLLKGNPVTEINMAAIQRLLEVSSIRPLNDADIIDLVTAKMGLPKVTPEIAAKLEDFAAKIRAAPQGSDKVEATRQIMAYMQKLLPLKKGEVFWAMWYANMLSGYQTQERNLLSTTANVIANLGTSMLVDPKNAPFALMGFISGVKSGWQEFGHILQTGEMPLHMIAQSKIESPTILETSPFKNMAKVFNNWKYVLRLMVAEDALLFKPAQEAQSMMIAADLARTEGLSGIALWKAVSKIMGKTTEQQAEFEATARAEGKTGLRLQRRIQELAEQQRPESVTAPSIDYAKRGTFNYQPEGIAGLIGQKIREISRRHPLLMRPIVPFTQIVANVTNTSLDYTPWGFIRAKYGISQREGPRRKIVGHEQAQLRAKALIGSSLMIAAYMADRMGGGDDDDDKGRFAIYGKGSGNANKDNQMREKGWKPYTVRFRKTYVSYVLTPFAIPLGIIGNIRDAQRYRKLDEKSILARAAFAMLRSVSVITDMSFMSGLTQFLEMLKANSPEQAEKMLQAFAVRSTVGAVVPNFFKQLDRTFDPNLRDNVDVIEATLREIPIASRLDKTRINRLGDPIKQQVGPVSLVITKDKDSPIWNLIVANDAYISKPDKQFQSRGQTIAMSEGEYYQLIHQSGQEIKAQIEKNLARFQDLTAKATTKKEKDKVQERIREFISDTTDRATERARNQIVKNRRSDERRANPKEYPVAPEIRSQFNAKLDMLNSLRDSENNRIPEAHIYSILEDSRETGERAHLNQMNPDQQQASIKLLDKMIATRNETRSATHFVRQLREKEGEKSMTLFNLRTQAESKNFKPLDAALENHAISRKEYDTIVSESRMPALTREIQHMEVKDAMQVWVFATTAERKQIKSVLRSRIINADNLSDTVKKQRLAIVK